MINSLFKDVKFWAIVKLADCLEMNQAGIWGDEATGNHNYPILRSTNISNGVLDFTGVAYRSLDNKTAQKYELANGDILVTKSSGSSHLVGKNILFTHPGNNRSYLFSNFMQRLRVNSNLILPEYLYFYLNSPFSDAFLERMHSTTSGLRNLNIDQYAFQQIPLPPLPEQRRIAAILREADEIRKLRREANKKIQGIVEALFYEMFGDPETNPKNWNKRSLSQLGTLDRGKSQHRPRDAAHLYGGPYPFIQTGDVANANGWITNYTQTYSEAGLNQSHLWPKGTLCITIAANIAKTAILTFDACFPDSVVGFSPASQVTIEYIRQWFLSIQKKLEQLAPQSAQKNINLDILRKLILPIPPRDLQDDFSAKVLNIYTTSEEQATAYKKIEGILSSLLSQAFTGELTASWREQHTEELAQAARERDALLHGQAAALVEAKTLESLTPPQRDERREDLIDQLSPPQQAILDIFVSNMQIYFTANQFHDDYEEGLLAQGFPVSRDRAKRELRTLAALGLICEVTLPVDQSGSVTYATVYRYPQLEDETASEDLALLATRSRTV